MQNEFVIENISKYNNRINDSKKAVRWNRIEIGIYSLLAGLNIILALNSQSKINGVLYSVCFGLSLINVGLRTHNLKGNLKELNYLKEEAKKYCMQMDPLNYYNSCDDTDYSLSMKKK